MGNFMGTETKTKLQFIILENNKIEFNQNGFFRF